MVDSDLSVWVTRWEPYVKAFRKYVSSLPRKLARPTASGAIPPSFRIWEFLIGHTYYELQHMVPELRSKPSAYAWALKVPDPKFKPSDRELATMRAYATQNQFVQGNIVYRPFWRELYPRSYPEVVSPNLRFIPDPF